MIQCIRAVYENGVLRPLDALTLEENIEVRITVETKNGTTIEPTIDDPLANIRFDGPPDFAERFDDYRFGRITP